MYYSKLSGKAAKLLTTTFDALFTLWSDLRQSCRVNMLGTASTTLEFSFGLISPVMSRGGWLLQPTVYTYLSIYRGRPIRMLVVQYCKNGAVSNQLTNVARERHFCWDGSESNEAVQK
jgi:hypothetical protein